MTPCTDMPLSTLHITTTMQMEKTIVERDMRIFDIQCIMFLIDCCIISCFLMLRKLKTAF